MEGGELADIAKEEQKDITKEINDLEVNILFKESAHMKVLMYEIFLIFKNKWMSELL